MTPILGVFYTLFNKTILPQLEKDKARIVPINIMSCTMITFGH